ncbi:MAG TPA: hypothetical protein VEV82_00620 [Actinomycetota bacterium]|nr:hypothetical protein [Actinomycetota bacterium]
MATSAKGNKKSSTRTKSTKKNKSPRCRTCGNVIRVPKGWTQGPAIRRHYWREHREVMQGRRES